jgi:hypothetical protein
MNRYSLFHLSDQALTDGLGVAVARERENTAVLLAHIAEFDSRGLFAPAGFSCMHGYCVGVLGLSEDAAYERLQAARTARQHPAVFAMVAEGRLHLTAVVRLTPHLVCMMPDSAAELLETAAGRSKSELEVLFAERFPRPDLQARVRPMPVPGFRQLVPEPVGTPGGEPGAAGASAAEAVPALASGSALVPEPVGTPGGSLVPEPVVHPDDRPRVALRSPERYGIQFTMVQATHDLLRHVEDLLGPRLGSDEMDQAFAAGLGPSRPSPKSASSPRPTSPARRTTPRAAGTSRPGSNARSGNAMVAGARSSPRPAGAAMRSAFSSTTILPRSLWAGRPRSRTCACAAGGTISSKPIARLEPGSCSRSGKTGVRCQRDPGSRQGRGRQAWTQAAAGALFRWRSGDRELPSSPHRRPG